MPVRVRRIYTYELLFFLGCKIARKESGLASNYLITYNVLQADLPCKETFLRPPR